MIPYAKPALIASFAAAIAAGSWMARGWFEDSKDLAAVEAQHALAAEIRGDMSAVARTVEDKLAGLKSSERIIDRGIIREIQKPVFRNVCVPAGGDAFRLLEDLAAGNPARKPDDQGAPLPATAD